MKFHIKKKLFPVVIFFVFVFLFALTLTIIFRNTPNYDDSLIVNDIKKLHDIFQKINADVGIIGFEHERNYIDFLNVTKFVGSEVGSMNVKYPEKWQGPYLKDNPTIQEKLYEVVKTKQGYFIVPGNGVKLSNGKIIGKDIIFNNESDVSKMMQNTNQLNSKYGPLAANLKFLQKFDIKENVLASVLKSDPTEIY